MVESITFDKSGWHEHVEDRDKGRIVWGKAGDVLSLDICAPPRGGIKPMGRDLWLDDARSMAKPGGIVSVDACNAGSWPAIQIIYKREHGAGYMYTGILVFDYKGQWCQITMVAGERGTTGIREALLTPRLLQAGAIRMRTYPFYLRTFKRASGYLEGWFQDPYDPRYRGVVLRNITDNEEYDAEIPDHPLSRVRDTLKTVRNSLRSA